MVNHNPFRSLAPRKEEFAPEKKKIVEELKKKIKPDSFIVIYAEEGMGRTLVLNKLLQALKTKHSIETYDFDSNLVQKLKIRAQSKKKSVIAVETLAIAESEFCSMVLDELKKLHDLGNILIVTATMDTYYDLKKNKKLKSILKFYHIPNLTYEQSKSMIITRLNDNRSKKSNSIDPFTEKELKHIWLKSRGNPKMVLMICSLLYDSKAQAVKA